MTSRPSDMRTHRLQTTRANRVLPLFQNSLHLPAFDFRKRNTLFIRSSSSGALVRIGVITRNVTRTFRRVCDFHQSHGLFHPNQRDEGIFRNRLRIRGNGIVFRSNCRVGQIRLLRRCCGHLLFHFGVSHRVLRKYQLRF
ncbi:hypothetical protein NPIL_34671 [Nephila pilipes]|uniref:Uncharacterized protein n=1 Tax=Nephila pilipes TaxID=299642 RepID=A0A8X6TVB1_NEPPI|nr:hypothetical protein NPIL_34671 [Nephila pilipes]